MRRPVECYVIVLLRRSCCCDGAAGAAAATELLELLLRRSCCCDGAAAATELLLAAAPSRSFGASRPSRRNATRRMMRPFPRVDFNLKGRGP